MKLLRHNFSLWLKLSGPNLNKNHLVHNLIFLIRDFKQGHNFYKADLKATHYILSYIDHTVLCNLTY